jgi:hypothetical protein
MEKMRKREVDIHQRIEEERSRPVSKFKEL